MTDPRDLESSLAEMDRKLRELQRELELLSRPPEQEPEQEPEHEQEQEPPPPPPPSPPAAPPASSPAGAIEQAAARVAELGRRIDALTDLRKELEEATSALREEQRQAASSQASQ